MRPRRYQREDPSSDEENMRAKLMLRISSADAMAASGTERAVEFLGSGKGIAPDLQGTLRDHFFTAVRAYVGVYGLPERYEHRLPADKSRQIKRIYAQYGRKYRPIKEDYRMRRMTPSHR